MKKFISLITLTSFLMLISFNVKALSTCSSEREMELSSLANNVNVDYLEYDLALDNGGIADDEVSTSPAFYIRVYNLTSDLNIKVNLDGSKNNTYIKSSDAADDGIIYLDTSFASSVKNYTLTIRSNDTNCQNEALRTITITVPMRNYFSTYEACDDNSDFYLCQEFTTTDYTDVTDKDFTTKLDAYKVQKAEDEKKQSSITYKTFSFINSYKWYFIGAGIIALIIIILIVIRNRRRSKRLI